MLHPSTLKFISDLTVNNNKPWFETNRVRFDAAKTDFENLITEILERHSETDLDLAGLTAKQCIFRIHRDIRFSKDKTPYKSNFGASLDRGGKNSKFAGYYIHLEPGGKSTIGGGLWQPMPAELKKVRQEIDYCYDEFRSIITERKFKKLYGDLYRGKEVSLIKIPHGFEKENPAAEYLKLKSWFVLHPLTDKELTSKELVQKITDAFTVLMPLLGFLNRALEE